MILFKYKCCKYSHKFTVFIKNIYIFYNPKFRSKSGTLSFEENSTTLDKGKFLSFLHCTMIFTYNGMK